MTRASAHATGGQTTIAGRVSASTAQLASKAHLLLRAARPGQRIDDLYRDVYTGLVSTLTSEAIAQGIDPTTIPPHPRSKAARLLREANAAANDPTRKPMPAGKIRPKRSPIRE